MFLYCLYVEQTCARYARQDFYLFSPEMKISSTVETGYSVYAGGVRTSLFIVEVRYEDAHYGDEEISRGQGYSVYPASADPGYLT